MGQIWPNVYGLLKPTNALILSDSSGEKSHDTDSDDNEELIHVEFKLNT